MASVSLAATSCDLLENFYLCGIKHNRNIIRHTNRELWFAWKFLSLWYQTQLASFPTRCEIVVICLKISIFVVSNTTYDQCEPLAFKLWFAWKFLSLWYQTQPILEKAIIKNCCDLLENFYLCGIKHNVVAIYTSLKEVVICLKISIFVVSNTTIVNLHIISNTLWFAWKFLSLWYQTQPKIYHYEEEVVVICLKISIFVVSNTTEETQSQLCCVLWFAWKFLSLWYQTQRQTLP